jgi:hypothetical protein
MKYINVYVIDKNSKISAGAGEKISPGPNLLRVPEYLHTFSKARS